MCDLGISDGRISQIGGSPRRGREINAAGALVLPGGVDMHVHLSSPVPAEPGVPSWVDDFASGSAAAIAGGVTTIGNMTVPGDGQSPRQALARDLDAPRDAALVDYVLHPVMDIPVPEALADLPLLAAEGHTSLKLFMTSAAFDANAAQMVTAVKIAGQNGMVTLIHCEDGALVRFCGERLLAAGRGGLADWAAAGRWPPSGPRSSARSRSARRRGHRCTSSTSRPGRRWNPPAAGRRAACRSSSKPGRSTCT